MQRWFALCLLAVLITVSGHAPGNALPTLATASTESRGAMLDQPEVRVPAPSTPTATAQTLAVLPTETRAGQPGEALGSAVSTAGDIDGDDYADLVVGAPGDQRASIYRGTADGLTITPTHTLTATGIITGFGSAVSIAGDVNGDGLSAIVIGAPGAGRAFVYAGAPTGLVLTPTTELTATGVITGFGGAVATAGDVDGDGRSEVIVGAADAARVFVYSGASIAAGATTVTPTLTIEGLPGSGFGAALDTAGDSNRDGLADIIVGAPISDTVFLYPGTTSGISTTAAVSATRTGNFGAAVSAAGDVNGDTFSDIVVGAPGADTVYVFAGAAAGLAPTEIFSATEASPGNANSFGTAVSTGGDINGDGLADLLVGSPRVNSTYLYTSTLAGTRAGTGPFQEPQVYTATGGLFGSAVNTAGDIDGDGFGDIAIGAPTFGNGLGQVTIAYGRASGISRQTEPNGESIPDLTLTSPVASGGFGRSINTAGDVNGDGFSDVIIGHSTETLAYIYHGSAAGLEPTVAATLGLTDTGNLISVDTAGDVDGDGFDDVVMGEPEYDLPQPGGADPIANVGRVLFFRGSATGVLTTPARVLLSEQPQENAGFGFSVSNAGDVNGDGLADVLISENTFDATEQDVGRVFLYYGTPTGLSPTPAWTLVGDVLNAELGFAVATAGDVNGDGYSDIIVGAPFGDRIGEAYIFHGGPLGPDRDGTRPQSTPADADTLLREGTSNDFFGSSVATAGDVNGDGFADVLVSAIGLNRMYLYSGSATGIVPTERVDLAVSILANRDRVRQQVSTAGDVNGDGFADVLVASLYAGAPSRRGAARLYFGAATGLDTSTFEDVTRRGFNFHTFGDTVATAGDVNGDGFADPLISTWTSNEAYIYYGNAGAGLALQPRQLGVLSPTLQIAHMGRATAARTIYLSMIGQMPLGQTAVGLEWQVAPLGTPFTATTILSGTTPLTFTSGMSTTIPVTVTGLDIATPYRWRARLHYPTVNRLGLARSRWVHIPLNGDTEQDFRTRGRLDLTSDGLGQRRPETDGTTTLTATIDLEDATVLSYTWDVGVAGIPPLTLSDNQTTTSSINFPYLTPGIYTVTVAVDFSLDGETEVFSRTRQISVAESALVSIRSFNDGPKELPQTATFSATLTGDAVPFYGYEFSWDFGDGSSPASGITATHTYPAIGIYTATVVASNTIGAPLPLTSTTTISITDEPISGASAVNDSPGELGSTTTLTATIAAGTNPTYTWDFGAAGLPGVQSTPGVTKTHTVAGEFPVGTYTVTVEISNSVSITTATTVITIGDVPIAGLSASNNGPTVLGTTTDLNATIDAGTNVDYVWDFGDGNTGSGAAPSHTYAEVGSYTARVTATNAAFAPGNQATATTVVSVTDVAVTDLTIDATSPTLVGAPTAFSVTANGSNIEYTWDFGDGSDPQSGASVAHTYQTTGTYTVMVTARNSAGAVTQQGTMTVLDTGLAITKTAPAIVNQGGDIEFTILITNVGSALLSTLRISDTLPSGVDLVTASNDGQLVGGAIVWEVERLVPGASLTRQLSVSPQTGITSVTNQQYEVSAVAVLAVTRVFSVAGSESVRVTVRPMGLYVPILLGS